MLEVNLLSLLRNMTPIRFIIIRQRTIYGSTQGLSILYVIPFIKKMTVLGKNCRQKVSEDTCHLYRI